MKNLLFIGILFLAFFNVNLFAQQDIQLGKSNKIGSSSGGQYDYSDPNGINIKVMVWGYVKFPGQYIIPASSNVNNLLSLAGGPTENAELDALKIFRINRDSSQTIINFNYKNLLDDNSYLSDRIEIPKLRPGDILLVPGSPKWYFRDYFSFVLSMVSALASLAAIFIYVYKK